MNNERKKVGYFDEKNVILLILSSERGTSFSQTSTWQRSCDGVVNKSCKAAS